MLTNIQSVRSNYTRGKIGHFCPALNPVLIISKLHFITTVYNFLQIKIILLPIRPKGQESQCIGQHVRHEFKSLKFPELFTRRVLREFSNFPAAAAAVWLGWAGLNLVPVSWVQVATAELLTCPLLHPGHS